MKYKGVDYINKTPKENLKDFLEYLSIELVSENAMLMEAVKQIAVKHIDIMIKKTSESDEIKNRGICSLAPTWKEMKKELNAITFD